jgi:hypothetical protein
VGLVLDDAGGEAVAEDVAVAGVAVVVVAGVALVEALHSGGEVGLRRLEDEVVVGAHEAERLHIPAEAFDHVEQDQQEGAVVVDVAEEERVGDRAGGRVIEAVGQFAAGDSRHGDQRRSAIAVPGRCGRIGTHLLPALRAATGHVRGLSPDTAQGVASHSPSKWSDSARFLGSVRAAGKRARSTAAMSGVCPGPWLGRPGQGTVP